MLHNPFVVDRHALAVLHQADAFETACGNDRPFAGHDALRRKRDRLQARAAKAVHRHARHSDRQAGADGRLPRDVLTRRALGQCAAEDDVLDFPRIDARALDCIPDDMAAKISAVRHVEGAAISLTNRCARGGNDDGVGHFGVSLGRRVGLEAVRTGNVLSGFYFCRRFDRGVKGGPCQTDRQFALPYKTRKAQAKPADLLDRAGNMEIIMAAWREVCAGRGFARSLLRTTALLRVGYGIAP